MKRHCCWRLPGYQNHELFVLLRHFSLPSAMSSSSLNPMVRPAQLEKRYLTGQSCRVVLPALETISSSQFLGISYYSCYRYYMFSITKCNHRFSVRNLTRDKQKHINSIIQFYFTSGSYKQRNENFYLYHRNYCFLNILIYH